MNDVVNLGVAQQVADESPAVASEEIAPILAAFQPARRVSGN